MNLDTINSWLTWLDKIQGLSAVALVMLACLAVGYIFRFIKSFPNNAIPIVVVLFGSVAMMLMATGRETTMPMHVWVVRNFVVGLIIGALSWLVHFLALSRLENFIKSKMPTGGNDTTFFDKAPPPVDQTPKNP